MPISIRDAYVERGQGPRHRHRPAARRRLGDRRRDDGISARIRHHLKTPDPDGESWEQAVDRVARFLADLPLRWAGRRVLVIGHVATRWALDIHLGGRDLADLATTEFGWQEGWEYEL